MIAADESPDLAPRIAISAIIAVIVAVVAAVRSVGPVLIVVAVIAAVGAFWLFDMLLNPSGDSRVGVAPERSGGRLPATSTDSLRPPRGVEAPTIAEPIDDEAKADDQKRTARLDPALFDPQSVEIKSGTQGGPTAFSVRIAKHGNSIAECEDAVTIDPRRSVLAVADGASSSFGADVWADTLTKHFVRNPPKPLSVGSFSTWLGETRAGSPAPGPAGDSVEGAANGWWSEHGERQGAYSTIVGAAIMTDGDARVVTVMCLGDSCAFVLTGQPGQRVVRRALPYEDASQFGSHPALLGSVVDRIHDEPSWTTVPTALGDLVVLASDAVSEWLLGDPKRFSLLDGEAPEAIATRLVAERTDGRIVNDDLTLAVLELSA